MNAEDIEIIEIMKNSPRLFGGKEVILGLVGEHKRLGWVYKDTGLPPTEEETKAVVQAKQIQEEEVNKLLAHEVSEDVLDCTVEEFLEYGSLSFYLPFQYSTGENGDDGIGGEKVTDPLTIYMTIDIHGGDDRITFKTTMRELLYELYELHESFVDPVGLCLEPKDVKMFTQVRDALLEEAKRIDGWMQAATIQEQAE